MKIALALFNWFPYGGLQRDCYRIGQALLQEGATVDVITMEWQGDDPEEMKLVIPELTGGSRIKRRYQFAEFVTRQSGAGNYDAVVGFNRLPGLDFYYAADICFGWKAYRERSWLYRLASRTRQYLAFERAVFEEDSLTRIFYLSPQQKEEYLALYPHAADRMTIIPPGIARDRQAGDDASVLREAFRAEHGIGENEVLILQVGNSFGVKGVDRSLEAVASLPEPLLSNTRFFVVGQDEPGRFARQANNLGIADKVGFFAGIDNLPSFFQGADLLLHPSRKESAGMVILEAIVAGLPVLTTDTCGYAFHVEKAGAGRVCKSPFRQKELNAALEEMLRSNDRGRWRKNGISYGQTEDLYDMPEKIAQQIMAYARERQRAR